MTPGIFSFIGDEFESLFRHAGLMLPGVQKITGVYYSGKEHDIRLITRNKDGDIYSDSLDTSQSRERVIAVQKYRSSSHPFMWIRKEEVPFEIPEEQARVGDIFTEAGNIILALRYYSEGDRLYNLLFVYFNPNLGNFRVNQSEKILSTDNKSIIGTLLYHQFKAILEINRSNRSLLVSLSHSVRSVIQENHLVKEQLQQVRMSYGESIVNLAVQQLQEISARYARVYSLSAEALDKIRDFRGNLRHLPAILENAVIFSENIMGDDGEAGVIYGYCLDFDSYQVSSNDENYTRRIDSRTSRSMQILDRLEKASLSLKSRNHPLTSANVGRELDPPVTAPAITDALSKNKEIIRQLLEKYPERWEIIRTEFRPLLNLVRKSASSGLLEERA